MNDDNAVATKKDIQMILDAMNGMSQDMEQKIEKSEKHLKKRIEKSELHTRILIEDLEERVFGSNKDQFSVHEGKLKNHEVRITDLEAKPVFV